MCELSLQRSGLDMRSKKKAGRAWIDEGLEKGRISAERGRSNAYEQDCDHPFWRSKLL